jgi:hypothetical protein
MIKSSTLIVFERTAFLVLQDYSSAFKLTVCFSQLLLVVVIVVKTEVVVCRVSLVLRLHG